MSQILRNEAPDDVLMQDRRAFIVLNPVAGRCNADLVRQVLDLSLALRGWSYMIYQTTGHDDFAAVLGPVIQERYDLVIAAGGDGTVSAVAQHLSGSYIPLGILPVGTANVLALELGIPFELAYAAALFADEHQLKKLDMMQVGDRRFLLQIGVGLDSLMIQNTARAAKRRFGRAAYLVTLLGKMIGYQSQRCTLLVDGQRMRPRVWQLLVANAGTLGVPPFRWGPDIAPSDGELDLCIFNVRLPFDYVRIGWQMLTGGEPVKPNVTYVRVKRRVIVSSDHAMPVQADGEIIGETPIQIDVLPQAITIVVPSVITDSLSKVVQEAAAMINKKEQTQPPPGDEEKQAVDEQAALQTRAALEEAIAAIQTPAQAEQVIADLKRMAGNVTEPQVAAHTPTPPDAAAAATVIQGAAAISEERKPQHVIAATAAQIAAAAPEDEQVLADAVQQVTNPKATTNTDEELARQRQLLRDALLKELKPLSALDVRLFLNVNHLPHPHWFNTFMYVLTSIMNRGDGWVLGMLIASMVNHRKGRRALIDVLPALWLATATVEFPIKHLVRRRRPFITLVQAIVVGRKPGSYSFPSGHSAAAFAGATLLRRHYPEWTPAFYTLAALVGFSRIYLGAHYPGDVCTGAISGTILAEAYRYAWEQLLDFVENED